MTLEYSMGMMVILTGPPKELCRMAVNVQESVRLGMKRLAREEQFLPRYKGEIYPMEGIPRDLYRKIVAITERFWTDRVVSLEQENDALRDMLREAKGETDDAPKTDKKVPGHGGGSYPKSRGHGKRTKAKGLWGKIERPHGEEEDESASPI